MYVLRKNGRVMQKSRKFHLTASLLNKIAGFKVITDTKCNPFCWIEYKEYSLKWEK